MTVKEHAHVPEKTAEHSTADLQNLMTRFYDAASTGDFAALDRLTSRRAGLLWIGTDPGEWWESPEAVSSAWKSQAAELGKPPAITGSAPTVYQHGDVAWVSDRPAFHLPDGRTLPFRFTAIWVREADGWRIVQAHASFGIKNEAVLRAA